MGETLQQYRDRTGFMADSLARTGGFRTSGGLTKKVAPDGHFVPFYGNAVIFMLPQPMIRWLAGIQDALYMACGECLAERIAPETFHVTLHDLRNQADQMPDGAAQDQQEALSAIAAMQGLCPHGIVLRSRCMFSMVGTSIVMGFEPAAEQDCTMLMTMYERFQQIVPLSYPLTLHVTLAYYRPGEYGDETLMRLRDAMQHIGREPQTWHLDMQGLHYATFASMARYQIVDETGNTME